ncbi:MAG: hypothetical protein GWP06_00520 [Actinobacteria bacterium]|nr:hypothetical protein [Actinomycetota bacterium]
MKVKEQLAIQYGVDSILLKKSYLDKLTELLQSDLDFHNQRSNYSSHNLHSFPAKFPPQLPKKFILELTTPQDIVLDPMAGSGTTVLEAFLANRKGIGFDIDPLAIKLAIIKTTIFNRKKLVEYARLIYSKAQNEIEYKSEYLDKVLKSHFDSRTAQFIDYWFLPEVQRELIALLNQIVKIKDEKIRSFFEVIFSSIIITKTGGVSLALDLAHTRPHRAKIIFDKKHKLLFGEEYLDQNKRRDYVTKTFRSPLEEFEKKFHTSINGLLEYDPARIDPEIRFCDSQQLQLPDCSVDLIVTSPPYASNAIDYMRAHKFSLVWLGYQVDNLTLKRKAYIGGELVSNFLFEELPDFSKEKVRLVSGIDRKRGNVLKRYYSEMTRALKEMYRVLRPGKAAIVVVGSSIMRGIDTETHKCLAEIGENLGFIVPRIGVRKLDRNKRMLPAGMTTDLNSQIQQRMHEEYVIGFYKASEPGPRGIL